MKLQQIPQELLESEYPRFQEQFPNFQAWASLMQTSHENAQLEAQNTTLAWGVTRLAIIGVAIVLVALTAVIILS